MPELERERECVNLQDFFIVSLIDMEKKKKKKKERSQNSDGNKINRSFSCNVKHKKIEHTKKKSNQSVFSLKASFCFFFTLLSLSTFALAFLLSASFFHLFDQTKVFSLQ